MQLAIIEYVTAYPAFVSKVYHTFHPFDIVEGTGLVSAPAEDVLLHPFQFTIENPPELGKVWAAQERLWTQRTILEVIAEVNKDAKDWNTATIKQINLLEVGNGTAQDQKSIATGEALNEAPAIVNPTAPPPPPDPAKTAPGAGQATQSSADSVYYISNASTQFKVLPFEISILIEQDHIQDLLVALENSPMAIQVLELEMSKPITHVVKPVKGQSMNYQEYGGSHAGGAGLEHGSLWWPAAAPGGFRLRHADAVPEGRDGRGAVKKATGVTIHDPYFNIVEVTVYGQARFYNPPPPEPPAEPSAAAPAPAPATPEATPPATEAPKDAAPAPAPSGEAPKDEAPKDEAPKDAAPAPAPSGEAPKAEAPKDAAPARAPMARHPRRRPGSAPAPK